MLGHEACHDLRMKLSLLDQEIWEPIVSEHCLHEHGELEFVKLLILNELLLE
jgi:hypothetical protein